MNNKAAIAHFWDMVMALMPAAAWWYDSPLGAYRLEETAHGLSGDMKFACRNPIAYSCTLARLADVRERLCGRHGGLVAACHSHEDCETMTIIAHLGVEEI